MNGVLGCLKPLFFRIVQLTLWHMFYKLFYLVLFYLFILAYHTSFNFWFLLCNRGSKLSCLHYGKLQKRGSHVLCSSYNCCFFLFLEFTCLLFFFWVNEFTCLLNYKLFVSRFKWVTFKKAWQEIGKNSSSFISQGIHAFLLYGNLRIVLLQK